MKGIIIYTLFSIIGIVFMRKKADSVLPFPALGGWVLALIAVIVLLVIMANSFGYIDLDFLAGVRLG